MNQLQIFKTPPKPTTETLIKALGEGRRVTRFDLYQDKDYGRLVSLIFANDEVISWW